VEDNYDSHSQKKILRSVRVIFGGSSFVCPIDDPAMSFDKLKDVISKIINRRKDVFFFFDENNHLICDELNVINVCFPFSKVNLVNYIPQVQIKEIKYN